MQRTGLQHRRPWLAISCLVTLLFSGAVLAQAPVETFIDDWLSAWQAQDTDAYLDFYHPDFTPSAYRDRAGWRQARIRNISRPAAIMITRDAIAVTSRDEETMTVRFDLTYRAPNYADRTRKEMTLALEDGQVVGILSEVNLAVEPLPAQRLDMQAQAPAPAQRAGETAEAPNPVREAAEPAAEAPGSSTGNNDVAAASQPPARTAPGPSREQAAPADWVPPGFEDLNRPQVTEIDVYYGGYFLTSVLAEFTDREVTILDSATLIDQLGNIKNPEAFRALLAGPLDAHTGLICYSDFQTDCGTLETDSVGVIFDRSLLRLWLFVAPSLLEDAGTDVIRFLPPSEAGLSFMNQSAMYFITDGLDVKNYNLFNNTLFAWGENRLSMRSNLVSDEGFDIDTLAFFREYAGKDYRLGLVRESANGFSFMNNERFVGASYGSSLLTRADLERTLGTEIELYLPTRSRVEIYREGRLISSDYYNVGNQLLDTADLPNGSYTIEIHIIDASGSETIEERYYSKTANIPPADQALYFLHVGRLENDLDVNRLSRTGQNELLLRGGFNKRLGRSTGGSIGFSMVENTGFLEMGLFRQGRNYEFQANAAYEDTGASGLDLRLRYRHPKYNLVLNGRQVFNGREDGQIGQDYKQYTGILEIPMRSGIFSFFHRQVERPLAGRNLNTGIRFRTRNRELPGGVLSSNIEVSKNNGEVLALWSFSWSMRSENHTTIYSPTLAYANDKSSRDSGLYGSYESNWYRGQEGGNEYVYTLRGDYDSQSSMEARVEADTGLGSADVTSRYNQTSKNVELSGRLSTSFATTGSSSAIGGKRRSESAFLVRVEGDIDADARFNVLVNGAVRGQLGANETLLIPVSPYNTYDVELQAVGETLVDLDNRIYRETMYPGNVVNLSWRSRVINIAIGRLVDPAGMPVTNAVIQNVVGVAMTDDNGVFQAEIDQETTDFEVLKGTIRCRASFDNPGTNNTILPLGTLECR